MKLSKTKIKINAVEIGHCFLRNNNTLTHFEADNLKTVGDYFLRWNESLTHFKANKLKNVGYGFLCLHQKRKEFCKLL